MAWLLHNHGHGCSAAMATAAPPPAPAPEAMPPRNLRLTDDFAIPGGLFRTPKRKIRLAQNRHRLLRRGL